MSLLYGPAILRHDFRQDLRVADILKLFPMPGWQVVLGEILAPAAILAGAQWALLILAFVLFPANVGAASVPLGLRLAVVLSAALVLPCVDFIAMLLPNAAALIFPAWVQLGKDTPRGFETMGQQLILMFGQIIVLMLTLLPAGLAAAAAYLTAWWLFGKVMAVAVISRRWSRLWSSPPKPPSACFSWARPLSASTGAKAPPSDAVECRACHFARMES